MLSLVTRHVETPRIASLPTVAEIQHHTIQHQKILRGLRSGNSGSLWLLSGGVFTIFYHQFM